MTQTISAQFDGKTIVPDEPLKLPPGQRLRVRIETVESDEHPLARIGELATDMGITNLAERHSEYARGKHEESRDVE